MVFRPVVHQLIITYASDGAQLVTLRVYDLNGNLLYNQQIPVSPGTPTRIVKTVKTPLEVYPIPATDVLYMKIHQTMV